MGLPFEGDILPDTVGLRLCKIVGTDDLRIYETVIFTSGRVGVLTTLNRASIGGHVGGPIDRDTGFWADQIDQNGDAIGEIRLDRDSWNSLKNYWMRCKMVRPFVGATHD